MAPQSATAQKQGNDACRWMVILGIGLLALILLSVKYGSQVGDDLSYSDPRAPPKIDPSSKDSLCTTKGCTEAASLIIQNMNPAIDPCEDFHEYACGKYNEKHQGAFWSEQEEKMSQQLLELILNDKSGMRAVEKARSFYETCKSLSSDTFQADLHEFVKTLGDIPLIGQERGPEMTVNPSFTELVVHTALYSYEYNSRDKGSENGLIGIRASVAGTYKVLFNEPEGVLFGFPFPQTQKLTESLLRSKLEEALKAVEKLGFDIAKSGREQMVNELIKFYRQLVQMYEDRSHEPVNLTISELRRAAPTYDWKYLIGVHLPETTEETEVEVNSLEDIKALSKILQEAPRDVLPNFLFLNWARHLSKRDVSRERLGCRRRLLHYFSKLTEHLALGTIRSTSDVEDVRNIGKEMRHIFHEIFDANTWLEPETKTKLKQRFDDIKHRYGYNTHALDRELVEKFYDWVPTPEKWNHMSMMRFEERANWFVDRMDLLGDLNYEPALDLNAFNRNNEEIIIPLAIITPPFYHPAWPLEFNYGGIGEIIGHELTHTFDDVSDMPPGNVGNDTDEYKEKEQCFTDQFGNVVYSNPRLNITIQADGFKQHKETIADNNGLRATWRAYKEKRQKLYGRNPPKLPGLQEFTNDQLFFLAHTQVECGRQPTIYAQFRYHWIVAVHPVGNVRINEKLKSFDSFANAFKCKLNSTMNPTKPDCRIWRHYH